MSNDNNKIENSYLDNLDILQEVIDEILYKMPKSTTGITTDEDVVKYFKSKLNQ